MTAETVRQVAASAVQQARALQVAAVTVGVHGDLPLAPDATAQALAEGLELGAYRYWTYRSGLTTEQTFAVERATVMIQRLVCVSQKTSGSRNTWSPVTITGLPAYGMKSR